MFVIIWRDTRLVWIREFTESECEGNGIDAFGFNALPAGSREWPGEGYYLHEGVNAIFWSATDFSKYYAYILILFCIFVRDGNCEVAYAGEYEFEDSFESLELDKRSKNSAYSVRPIRD